MNCFIFNNNFNVKSNKTQKLRNCRKVKQYLYHLRYVMNEREIWKRRFRLDVELVIITEEKCKKICRIQWEQTGTGPINLKRRR